MRRWLWLVVIASSLVGVTVGVAWSQPAAHRTVDATHYTRFYLQGPGAVYESDSGGIGLVDPIQVHLPAGTYYGVVTVSFGYITQSERRFTASVYLRTRTVPYHYLGLVRPSAGRTLLPAPRRTSTTLVFEIVGVPGDRDLDLAPTVNATPGPTRTSIGTANVVVDAQFRPMG